ncbi:MAG: mannitol dehydrogenase family protein [Rhodobacteraceae bacterium]|nr:mannitol dehydrogenase family protein [Paracoccaceae bacterium]
MPPHNRPAPGIVHLGLGAFYRAHGAIYTAEAIKASGGNWGIIGVSLMRPDQRDLLAPQGFAYTALELGPEGKTAQVLDVISDILVARENPEAVLAAMADPAIKIVSLTVTEKGYCRAPATGALDQSHPAVVYDLANSLPRSSVGFLVRALQRRMAAGLPPFTVLCCDNLPENGNAVRGVVLEMATLIDPALADWIRQNCAFPSTMVDRIVPATKPEDISDLARKTGILDVSPVMHEPFRQWVIEDNFVNNDRPDYAAAGAQMVSDVTVFEHMKLRCLNGTHSALAYLGFLAGHQTICDTVTNPAFAAYCRSLWASEIIPCLTPPEGVNLSQYAEALFVRYSNPAIRHLTSQIAMDGSQKLPQRMLETISENLKAGRESRGLILAVAAWIRYVGGLDENGHPIKVQDPMANDLRAFYNSAKSPEGKVEAFLKASAIFPPSLASTPAFRVGLVDALSALIQHGAQACVAKIAR